MTAPAPARADAKPCPICGKAANAAYRPFCSRRCADVDLNRWLSDGYVIPGAAEPDEDADDAPPTVPPARTR